jgi:hypothetical protein
MSLEKRAAAGAEAAAATLSSVQTMLTAVANRKRRLNSAQSPIMDKTAVREREREAHLCFLSVFAIKTAYHNAWS